MSVWRWIMLARRYSIRSAFFYWREDRKPENAAKVVESE